MQLHTSKFHLKGRKRNWLVIDESNTFLDDDLKESFFPVEKRFPFVPFSSISRDCVTHRAARDFSKQF